jgi:hypothetical protein
MGPRAYRNLPVCCSRLAALAALAVLLAPSPGCAARRFDALMRSWQGHPVDELFRTWGAPNFLFPDGQGGQVAVYVPNPIRETARAREQRERLRAATRTRVYEAAMKEAWPIHRLFFVDASGRIVRTEWKGEWECCSN